MPPSQTTTSPPARERAHLLLWTLATSDKIPSLPAHRCPHAGHVVLELGQACQFPRGTSAARTPSFLQRGVRRGILTHSQGKPGRETALAPSTRLLESVPPLPTGQRGQRRFLVYIIIHVHNCATKPNTTAALERAHCVCCCGCRVISLRYHIWLLFCFTPSDRTRIQCGGS